MLYCGRESDTSVKIFVTNHTGKYNTEPLTEFVVSGCVYYYINRDSLPREKY